MMNDKMCKCGHYESDHGDDGSCESSASTGYCPCFLFDDPDTISPDPRDAEIAALKAEVERLRESEADLIQWIFDGGQRAGIEPADLSPTEVLTRMSDDLAAHKRALAAGPAALHYRSCDCCSIVEAAQAEAMKGGDVTDTIDSLRARLAEVERERDAVLWERNAIEDRLATAIAQSAEARGRLAEIEIEMRMMLPPGKTLLEILRERVAVRVALGGDASPLADDDSLLRAQCALAACAEMREALERQLDEHKRTWLTARAEVEGEGVSACLFEAEPATIAARAAIKKARGGT